MGFTRITLHHGNIQRLAAGPVARKVETVARHTANIARVEAPKDKGLLAASIHDEVHVLGLLIHGRVYSRLPYVIYQHEGTGVYAGRGPIRPKRANYLKFKPKGSNKFVYAKQVKGVPPNPFLLRALVAASPWPVRRKGRR